MFAFASFHKPSYKPLQQKVPKLILRWSILRKKFDEKNDEKQFILNADIASIERDILPNRH
jgi:hypothetical protein